MENTGGATGTLKAKSAGTYDFGNPIEKVKAIDQAMRHYLALTAGWPCGTGSFRACGPKGNRDHK